MVASTAAAVWDGGKTTIGYACVRSAPATTTSNGLEFPTFQGVERNDPREIHRLSPQEASGLNAVQIAMLLIQQIVSNRA